MLFRLADKQDTEKIMNIIGQAKERLRQAGIDQWQDGYPTTKDITKDIEEKNGYVLDDGGSIAGYVCISFDGEKSYEKITGQWKSSEPYAVIHRAAIADEYAGQGLASEIFTCAEALCREKNVHSIKIDTGHENAVMKHLIAKHEYEYCGTIYYEGAERIAFEKIVK